MKLTKTITHSEIIIMDIETPYFTKNADYCWAILSEDNTLRVMFKEYLTLPPSVAINYSSMVNDALKGEPITQKEFEDAFQKANDFLSEQFEKLRDRIMKKSNEVYDLQDNVQQEKSAA